MSELKSPPSEPDGGAARSALAHLAEIVARFDGRRPALFFDYDGTLTPIAALPELAVLSDAMRNRLVRLSGLATVAIISGRDRLDAKRMVGLDGLVYAGSHGFDISGPHGLSFQHVAGLEARKALHRVATKLNRQTKDLAGTLVEAKRFAVAAHYRLASPADAAELERLVDETLATEPLLTKTFGKAIFEIRPRVEWHKGKAVLWLLDHLGVRPAVVPLYIGDDLTDEDAFAAIGERGVSIAVGPPGYVSRARYRLDDVDAVGHFLDRLADALSITPVARTGPPAPKSRAKGKRPLKG